MAEKIGFEVEQTRTLVYEESREDLIELLQEDLDWDGDIPEDDTELVKLVIELGGTFYLEALDIDQITEENVASVYEA